MLDWFAPEGKPGPPTARNLPADSAKAIADGKLEVQIKGRESHVLGPGSAVKTRYDLELGIDQMVQFEKNVDLDAFGGTAAEEIASAPGSVSDRAERVKESLGAKHMLGISTNAVEVDYFLN